MNIQEAASLVHQYPFFKTGVLAAGQNLNVVRVQLDRWVSLGKVVRLAKGLYSFLPPYRHVQPDLFHVANAIKPGSYVSLQSALARYGLIPEHVPVVTSVTTGRPGTHQNELGTFHFHHIKKLLFRGFVKHNISETSYFYIATPEKALSDLLYLTPGSDDLGFLTELRLQHLDILKADVLKELAVLSESQRVERAVKLILEMDSEPEITI